MMGAEWRKMINYHGNEGRISRKRRKLSLGVSQRRRKILPGKEDIRNVFDGGPSTTKVKTRSGSGTAQSGPGPDARLHPFASVILRPYANWSHSTSINPSAATSNGPHAVSCLLLLSHLFVSPIFNSPILKLS